MNLNCSNDSTLVSTLAHDSSISICFSRSFIVRSLAEEEIQSWIEKVYSNLMLANISLKLETNPWGQNVGLAVDFLNPCIQHSSVSRVQRRLEDDDFERSMYRPAEPFAYQQRVELVACPKSRVRWLGESTKERQMSNFKSKRSMHFMNPTFDFISSWSIPLLHTHIQFEI